MSGSESLKGRKKHHVCDLDVWIWILKGRKKHYAEKEAEECGSKNASLLDFVSDVDGELITFTVRD